MKSKLVTAALAATLVAAPLAGAALTSASSADNHSSAREPTQITRAEYARVRKGMTVAKVTHIIHAAGKVQRRDSDCVVRTYTDGFSDDGGIFDGEPWVYWKKDSSGTLRVKSKGPSSTWTEACGTSGPTG